MSIVVAVKPGQRNREALALAADLAKVLGERVVAACVVLFPAGTPSPLRVGMADDDVIALIARGALDEARGVLGEALDEAVALRERSVRAGLLKVLERPGVTQLVVGPGRSGMPGRVALGDVAAGLLNCAAVPVSLAPAGYASRGDAHPIRQVTVAFGAGDGSEQALQAGAELAERADSMLRTATFWARPSSQLPMLGGPGFEIELADQWHKQMQVTVDAAVRRIQASPLPTRFIHTVFGDGTDWAAAMDAVEWVPGDLLVVGSRPRSGIRSVFLGSRAAHILRHAPVPVTVLPG